MPVSVPGIPLVTSPTFPWRYQSCLALLERRTRLRAMQGRQVLLPSHLFGTLMLHPLRKMRPCHFPVWEVVRQTVASDMGVIRVLYHMVCFHMVLDLITSQPPRSPIASLAPAELIGLGTRPVWLNLVVRVSVQVAPTPTPHASQAASQLDIVLQSYILVIPGYSYDQLKNATRSRTFAPKRTSTSNPGDVRSPCTVKSPIKQTR